METKSDFKRFYAQILNECISLMAEESQHEQEQIRIALEIGQKINQLMAEAAGNETVIKNLARDICRERGKMVSPSRLDEYRQLYLNLGSMETVNSLAERALNDISLSTLSKWTADGKKDIGNRGGAPTTNIVTFLEKVTRLLTRVETILEDQELNEEELASAINSIESVHSRANAVYKAIHGYGGPRQMDFFKPMRVAEHYEMGWKSRN